MVEFFEDFLGLFCGEECFGEYGVVVSGSFLVTLVCVGCAALLLPVANSASNAWCMNEIPDDQIGAIVALIGLINMGLASLSWR
ncbi:hypothetical protein [Arcanobacterium haemolyticum]